MPPHDKTNKMTVRPAKTLRCPHEETLGPQLPTECTAKTLIRLGGCQADTEPSLGAQSLCWFCHKAAHLDKPLKRLYLRIRKIYPNE